MDISISTVHTDEQLQDAFYIRKTVFVHEQNVPLSIELDEHDDHAIHFICYDGNKAVGAARLRFLEEAGKLERISVLKAYRGNSIGKSIIHKMEAEIKNRGYKEAILNSQTHAISFYEQLGYKVVSEEFMDANIPHVTMKKQL